MALPLCGRRRFTPTGIFPMLQTLFEAYYTIYKNSLEKWRCRSAAGGVSRWQAFFQCFKLCLKLLYRNDNGENKCAICRILARSDRILKTKRRQITAVLHILWNGNMLNVHRGCLIARGMNCYDSTACFFGRIPWRGRGPRFQPISHRNPLMGNAGVVFMVVPAENVCCGA